MNISRRTLVRFVPTLGAFSVSIPWSALSQPFETPSWPSAPPPPGAPLDEPYPTHHPFTVKEMVAVAHFDLARVKELLRKQPPLAKASWDWGFGDWETALGAASHVGQRAIAEVLLEQGAPPTLFSAAMLGQLDVVKAWLTAVPEALHARGPHSIPLIAHARAGGAAAAAVMEFLQSLGPQRPNAIEPLASEERAAIEGRYLFGDRPRDHFIVDTQQNQLGIMRAGATRRNLFHLGKLEFYPVGAPQVKVKFEGAEGKIAALAVFDPDLVVRAHRRSVGSGA